MQSLSAKLFSMLSMLCLAVCIVLRAVSQINRLGSEMNIAFYVAALIGAVLVVLSAIRDDGFTNAFELNDKKQLVPIAYISAIGFFASFVQNAVDLYLAIQSQKYNLVAIAIPMGIASVMAILSCFYYFTIGMSYSGNSYDFRRLKILHIAPVLWAVSSIVGGLTQAISPLIDVGAVVKYAALVYGVLYYFFFAKEVESDNQASKMLVLFARLFFYFAMLLSVDALASMLAKNVEVGVAVHSISIMLVSLFPLVHQQSIKS